MYDTQAEIDAFFACLYQFRPLKKLGEGAFGLALLVEDTVEGDQKVFKLPKERATTEALKQEGANLRLLSKLLHPNIIRLNQYGMVKMPWNGAVEERFYLNMDYGGTSLCARLGQLRMDMDENGNVVYNGSGHKLPVAEAVRIAMDVCSGLEAAHGFQGAAVRMIHRDVSPDNILIDEQTGSARLTDFGIARVIDRTTALVSFAGKLIYMDPECYQSRATVQSDLYSLAIVIYETVTGQLPFMTFAERMKSTPRPPRDLVPDVPVELGRIVLKALATDVGARYGGAAEMLADLRRLNARLNPLPPRYTRLGPCDDGRILCEDGVTKERVAVRLVCTGISGADLRQQSQRLERLNLANVEPVLDYPANESVAVIVSRAPAQPTLAERFAGQALERIEALQELCEAAAAVCDVLSACHAAGLTIGCLTPFSITLAPGRPPRLHETGLAPLLAVRAEERGELLEALAPQMPFLSPQFLAGGHVPNPADDIYALGATLCYLLTGRPPLDGDDLQRAIKGESLDDHLPEPRTRNRLMPPRLSSAIARAVRVNPAARFTSAQALAEELRACRWPDDVADGLIADALHRYPPGGRAADLIAACELLDKALWIVPGSPRADYARGIVYFRNGSFAHAVEELESAAKVAPGQDIYHLLAQCYHRWNNQYQKAVAAFRKALEFGEQPLILDHMARMLYTAGKREPAVRHLRRAAELEADAAVRDVRLALAEQWHGEIPAIVAVAEAPAALIREGEAPAEPEVAVRQAPRPPEMGDAAAPLAAAAEVRPLPTDPTLDQVRPPAAALDAGKRSRKCWWLVRAAARR